MTIFADSNENLNAMFLVFKYSTTMFSAAFCAMIFVWMLAIKTLQMFYLPLRYMNNAIASAIEEAKTAADRAINATIIDVIPDSHLQWIYQKVAEYQGKDSKLQISTLEEIHYWFQIVEGKLLCNIRTAHVNGMLKNLTSLGYSSFAV